MSIGPLDCLMLIVPLLYLVPVSGEAWSKCCTSDLYCQAPFISPDTYVEPFGLRLLQVNLFTRHGDRTPIKFPPHQHEWAALVDESSSQWLPPLLLPAFSPHAPGTLTFVGEQQHISLGETISFIYGDRLGGISEGEVKIASTPFPRTVISARSLLRGLFPTSHALIPIDIHQHPVVLMGQSSFCPRLQQLLNRIKSTKEYQLMQREMDELVVQSHLHDEAVSFFDIADSLFCRACHRFPLTRPPSGSEAGKFCELDKKAFSYVTKETLRDREILRLQAGHLLTGLQAALLAPSNHAKLNILSAHDTTLAHLHGALQTGHYQRPPYASNLIIELWTDDVKSTDVGAEVWASQFPDRHGTDSENSHIRILYNGQIVQLPWCKTPLKANGSGSGRESVCPVSAFLLGIQDLLTHGDDFQTSCMSRSM